MRGAPSSGSSTGRRLRARTGLGSCATGWPKPGRRRGADGLRRVRRITGQSSAGGSLSWPFCRKRVTFFSRWKTWPRSTSAWRAMHERQLRLPRGRSLKHRYEQCAGVQHCDQRRQPALVVVLGAVVAENRVGDMRLENLCGPALPLRQQCRKGIFAAFKPVTPQ